MSNENQKHENQQNKQQPTTPTSVLPPLETAIQELSDADLETIIGGVWQTVVPPKNGMNC
jgi:hypothetical protein